MCGNVFAFIGGIGTWELLIIGIIAVLLFGSRLPEVGRSLGKGLIEFKKGLAGIEDEVNAAASGSNRSRAARYEDERSEPSAPKFEPPPAAPQVESSRDESVPA